MKTMEPYNVKIFTDNVEPEALRQVRALMSIGVFSDCKVRIMPDVHAGAGCVIGFTGDLGARVVPNIVGVDIGCGILVQPLPTGLEPDFHGLHEHILRAVPSGRNVRDMDGQPLPARYMERYSRAKSIVRSILCYRELRDAKRLDFSLGTLGGGNHFIELDRGDEGRTYLLVHTGSRNLGKQVAEIYQRLAVKSLSGWDELMARQERIIAFYKDCGRRGELSEVIRQLHNDFRMRKPEVAPELAWLTGKFREDYLHDMRLCQDWAVLNRRLIADLLLDHLLPGADPATLDALRAAAFESVHNYIGPDNIIRKGAISARHGERCIIPLNMRDGALLCTGLGNTDWNCSAPHGAGRVMSRSRAFREITLDDFARSMAGVYSETVVDGTRDEAPMVYKPKDEIIANIRDTVDVDETIFPIFNFKAPG